MNFEIEDSGTQIPYGEAVEADLEKLFSANVQEFMKIPEMNAIDKLKMAQEAAERANRPDYKQFRADATDSWEEYYNDELSLADNFKNLLSECVILPSASVQVPIAVAYAMIPSAMANIVPILFSQGVKGSGKSTVGVLIAALHGEIDNILSATTTFAALRNHLDSIRYYDPISKQYEKNCCLIWDDISHETLNKPDIYSMLKSGYNRKTEVIEIAGSEGENIRFRTFSLKVMSSVKPFYAFSKYSELNRRCIVLKFKPFESFTTLERADAGVDFDFNINKRLDPDSINWDGFNDKFNEFWDDQERLAAYASLKKELLRRKKTFEVPKSISGEQWTISVDLLCTGVISGIWDSLSSGLEGIASYWEWHRLNIGSSLGALQKILKDLVASETENIRILNEAVGSHMYPIEVSPEKVKLTVQMAASKGELDVNPSPSNISEAMSDIGFKLDKNQVGSIVWMPLLD
jgi:hypothetical protein